MACAATLLRASLPSRPIVAYGYFDPLMTFPSLSLVFAIRHGIESSFVAARTGDDFFESVQLDGSRHKFAPDDEPRGASHANGLR